MRPPRARTFHVNLRQCIPADRAKAREFLQAALSEGAAGLDVAAMDHQLSLIAVEGETTVGIALCQARGASTEYQLAVVAAIDRPELVRLLVDKASSKLHAQGIHKFKITLHDGSDPLALWEAARWSLGVPAPEAAPAARSGKKKKVKSTPAAAAPSAN